MAYLRNLNIDNLSIINSREKLNTINLELVLNQVKKNVVYMYRLVCEDDGLIYADMISDSPKIDAASQVTYKINSFGDTYSYPTQNSGIMTFYWIALVVPEELFNFETKFEVYENNPFILKTRMVYFFDEQI